MIKVGDYVVFRDYRPLIKLCLSDTMCSYLLHKFYGYVDDIKSIDYIEVVRVNSHKWQITYMSTDSDSINLEEEKIYLTARNFNTKALLNAKPVVFENTLGMLVQENMVIDNT